jgi:hypothetical protein
MDHDQIWTWPAHSYIEPTHAIWTLYIYPNKTYRAETEISSRRITLSKNHQTMTKFDHDLHNPKMYPYTKFELNVFNRSRINERKPMIMEWWSDGRTKGNTICLRPIYSGGIKKVHYKWTYMYVLYGTEGIKIRIVWNF